MLHPTLRRVYPGEVSERGEKNHPAKDPAFSSGGPGAKEGDTWGFLLSSDEERDGWRGTRQLEELMEPCSPLHPAWEKSRNLSKNAIDVVVNCWDSAKAKVHIITA